MRVISTNISKKRTINIDGTLVETGIYKQAVEKGVVLGSTDVQEDNVVDRKYHGGLDMACYIFGYNNYPYFQTKYPNADWEIGMFGENITLDFLNESTMNIGDLYEIGEAIIQISQPRMPCSKLGYRLGDKGAIKYFTDSNFPGVYVRVLKPGLVSSGDEMNLWETKTEKLSILELYRILGAKSKNTHQFYTVISNPWVPEKCKLNLKE